MKRVLWMIAAAGLAAAASAEPFPSPERLLGELTDPLASLTAGNREEDLRDSLNALPRSAALEAGLRDTSVIARLAAVRAAARPRNVDSVPYLSGIMLRLDQPSRLRAAAALALGRIGDRIAVGALSEALKDPSAEVRAAAALALGGLPADGVVTRLESTLRSDSAWQPRYAAAVALGRARKTFADVALIDALLCDPAWQVRQQAARSLMDLATERAAEALASSLDDPEPSVRAAAGVALAEIGAPAERRAAARALRAETDPSVRAVVVVARRRSLPFP